MNLREYQNIHKRYIQHKCTFLHKVLYKLIVSTHFYLMVSLRTVKDAPCKATIRETLISRKRPVQAEVLSL